MKDITKNAASKQPPKLLHQLRRCMRDKHYSVRANASMSIGQDGILVFMACAPTEMGTTEVQAFLSYLANERKLSVSTHHQALCALVFPYKNVLQIDLPWPDNVNRPVKPVRKPTVLTRQELEMVLAQMEGIHLLIARLLYGTGMRLMECAQLRIKDVDFQRREIMIRQGMDGYR